MKPVCQTAYERDTREQVDKFALSQADFSPHNQPSTNGVSVKLLTLVTHKLLTSKPLTSGLLASQPAEYQRCVCQTAHTRDTPVVQNCLDKLLHMRQPQMFVRRETHREQADKLARQSNFLPAAARQLSKTV
jgi:hypothetical protein